jgi:hypothetical protein
MLNNTINLSLVPGDEAVTHAVSRIDTDNGSSTYKYAVSGGEYFLLKVSNLLTKENAPVGTNRVQIRIEHVKVLESGLQRTAFVSMVIASPRDTTFTTPQIIGLVQGLVTTVVNNTVPASLFGSTDSAEVFVTRLLSGEV